MSVPLHFSENFSSEKSVCHDYCTVQAHFLNYYYFLKAEGMTDKGNV